MQSVHRLNMELDLQSLFGLHVHSCTHWLRPRNPHPPAPIWAHIRGRYWSAEIDDIFVTPWFCRFRPSTILSAISWTPDRAPGSPMAMAMTNSDHACPAYSRCRIRCLAELKKYALLPVSTENILLALGPFWECSESYGESENRLNNCIPIRTFLITFMLVSVSDSLLRFWSGS